MKWRGLLLGLLLAPPLAAQTTMDSVEAALTAGRFWIQSHSSAPFFHS